MLFPPKESYPLVTCRKCGTAYRDDSDWSGDAHPERDCVRAQTERETVAAIVRMVRALADDDMLGRHRGDRLEIASMIEEGQWRKR